MALHKDEAIVLFKKAYGESDKIVRLFTVSSGKIAAIAKGGNRSQKRFANTLEPFNHIRVEYFEKSGKGMVRIENADVVETNNGIEKSLSRACTAGFFVEFVDKLTKERERHDELFYALKDVLNKIKRIELSYPDILYHQLKMLETLGFLPNFYTCVYCGKIVPDEKKMYFSKEKGGILCVSCARFLSHKAYGEGVIQRLAGMRNLNNGYELRVTTYESFFNGKKDMGSNSLVKEETVRFSGQQNPENNRMFERDAQDIMEGFISFHLDVEFKSYRILKGIIK